MKIKYTVSLLLMVLMVSFVIPPMVDVQAATCSGTSCNGLYPTSTGCSIGATEKGYIILNALTFTKIYKSTTCSTFYAYTVGHSSDYYLNATLKYYYNTYTSYPIQGNIVSPQRYGLSSAEACGAASTSGPISAMIYSPCVMGW
jgi:hypothetical protein